MTSLTKISNSSLEDYIVNRTNNLLGSGSYGEVYICFHKDRPKEKLAMKIIHLDALSIAEREHLDKMTQNEIKTLFSSEHPNTLWLFQNFASQNDIYLVTELCDHNLNRVIENLTLDQSFEYLDQIVRAMIYLNRKNIIHRDLKPANILLKNNQIKLADFGFARFVKDPKSLSVKTYDVGTPLYISPEIYKRQPYSAKCDTWSVGIIFFQMIYKGDSPWTGTSLDDLFVNNILKKKLEFPKKPIIKDELKDLISGMLAIEEKDRFDFKQIRNYLILYDQDMRHYCEYLESMAKFFKDLAEKLYDFRRIKKDARTSLFIVLKKFEFMCYSKLGDIATNRKGLALFESRRNEYQKQCKESQKIFQIEILEKFAPQKKDFSPLFIKGVFNDDEKISREYKVEYQKLFNIAIDQIWKSLGENLGELQDLTKDSLKIIIKILEMRSVRQIEKKYAFDDEKFYENPFEILTENLEELKKCELISMICDIKGKIC